MSLWSAMVVSIQAYGSGGGRSTWALAARTTERHDVWSASGTQASSVRHLLTSSMIKVVQGRPSSSVLPALRALRVQALSDLIRVRASSLLAFMLARSDTLSVTVLIRSSNSR